MQRRLAASLVICMGGTFAILFPVLMTSIIFMETGMEVRYVTR